MRYISVCSGIEAASCAWHPLGWQAIALSEIEPFPCKVLAHHYPDVPNWGDMTKFKEWPDAEPDILVGGTPCQSFSVAGLRKGLDDSRGGLMLVYLQIAARYQPRWVVWENVPGVLSIDGGRAFGALLGGLAELGYGFAYRVLDAQYFGVAQRRRRVFVVGHLGDWRRAAAVLFERHSLSGHPAPRREARQGAAGGAAPGAASGCIPELANVLTARMHKGTNTTVDEGQTIFPVAHSLRGEGFDASEDGTGRGTPLVPVSVALRGRDGGATAELGDDCAFALRASGGGGDKPHVLAFDTTQITSKANRSNPQPGDPCHPIAAGAHAPAIAFHNRQDPDIPGDITHPLGAQDNGMAVLIPQGENNASTQEGNAGTLLRRVRDEIGAEAFAQWGLGILDSLQSSEVLQSALHGSELRPAAFSRSWMVCCALGSPLSSSEGAVQSLREARGAGRTPPGWEPPKQLARELGAYLSGLSQPGPQAERFLRDMWQAAEGIWLLRQALSAIQEARRPAHVAGEARMQVRRLTPECCEFLQGFPRSYTDIRPNGKPTPDGPRYKALGNSMAVPVMHWIGKRIQMVEDMVSIPEWLK